MLIPQPRMQLWMSLFIARELDQMTSRGPFHHKWVHGHHQHSNIRETMQLLLPANVSSFTSISLKYRRWVVPPPPFSRQWEIALKHLAKVLKLSLSITCSSCCEVNSSLKSRVDPHASHLFIDYCSVKSLQFPGRCQDVFLLREKWDETHTIHNNNWQARASHECFHFHSAWFKIVGNRE